MSAAPDRFAENAFQGPSARALRDAQLLRRHRAGDERAREELFRDYLPLLRTFARSYHGHRELDDVLQVAAVGFLKAVDRFDFANGACFGTYVRALVRGEVARYWRDHGWAVHVPRDLKQLAVALERRLPELSATLGRSPTVAELAVDVGASEEAVVEALEAGRSMRTLSIAALTAEDGTADDVAAFAVFDSTPERFERRQLLEHGFRALTELQRRIVELRFYREWTQEQIAREVGISQMHVSRLLRQALAVLHDELQGVFDSAA